MPCCKPDARLLTRNLWLYASMLWVPGSPWTLVLLPFLTRMGQVESGIQGSRPASIYFPSGIWHPPLTLLSFDHFICGNIISSHTKTYPLGLLWEIMTESLHCTSVTGGTQSRNSSRSLPHWLFWFIPWDWLFLAPVSDLGEVSGSLRHFKVPLAL